MQNLTEAIYAFALDANYIVTKEHLSKEVQSLAQEYLFDAKVLVHIDDDSQIERFAKEGIDGVVYPEAFVKIVS